MGEKLGLKTNSGQDHDLGWSFRLKIGKIEIQEPSTYGAWSRVDPVDPGGILEAESTVCCFTGSLVLQKIRSDKLKLIQ